MKGWGRILAGLILATATSSAAMADAGELHISNWTDYTAPDLIAKFEAETGIKVTVDTYDSNETVLAKLKSGAGGYDLIVITNDFVPIFIKEGLLKDVAVSELPSFKNLDPRWRQREWDPEARYTVPWQWGTTSFSDDTEIYKGPTDSLKLLFEPPAELRGKIGMFGSPTELMSLALVYLGKPQCNANPADLKQLEALLMAQKPAVKLYNSDGIIDRQAAGETVMNQIWSGDALRARERRASLKYVYPKEGVVAWMDNLAVPSTAENVENARKFLDFVMRPENIAIESAFSGYQSAVVGTNQFLSQEVGGAPEFNPPPDLKLNFIPSCPENAIRAYDKIWTALRQ
jgi:spermidine/putrescine transport system substrate-binding protein